MKLHFSIPMGNSVSYHSSLCFMYSNYDIIDVDQVCYIVVTKKYSHMRKKVKIVRIARIKDSYIFDKNSKGSHLYAVYYVRSSRSYRAVGLTHLYTPDPNRFNQVKKRILMKTKFPNFETPSGVDNKFYSKNINGGNIDLKSKDILSISKRHLPAKQAKSIIGFAKKKAR